MSALTAAEQREVLELLRWLAAPQTGELRKRFPSRSPYRADDEPFETSSGVALMADRGEHMRLVEDAAKDGQLWALELLGRVASGRDDHAGNWLWYPDEKGNRQKDTWAIEHARELLIQLETTRPEVLQRGLAQKAQV